MRQPTLVAVSHGTSNPLGQARVAALAAACDGSVLAHVDVQSPRVADVLAGLPAAVPAVVVPLLLSAGYHVNVDLRGAARAAARSGREVVVAPALGPDDRLVDVLVRRVAEAGFVRGHHQIVLASAGSTEVGAVADCICVAQRLAARLGTPVRDAYLSAAQPAVGTVVAQLLAAAPKHPVLVVSHLLAPGWFQDQLLCQATAAGAETVTAPVLGTVGPVPDEVVEIVMARFTATVESCPTPATTAA